MSDTRARIAKEARRVVIKIGTSILSKREKALSHSSLMGIARETAYSQSQKKKETIVVSSGAIAAGMQCLGFKNKPTKMNELQACAAVGQPLLMQLYQKAFSHSKLRGAQVLLDRVDLEHPERRQNAKNTLAELIRRGIVPIINENDAVFVEEIRVGDNDNLAAMVACLLEADLLVLLTDQNGLFTADPRKDKSAEQIEVVKRIDHTIFAKASGTSNQGSTGGMVTKLSAAQQAIQHGIPTIIADGRDKKILEKIYTGASVGTLFLPS